MHAIIEMIPAREYKCHLWLSRNDDSPSPMYDEGWEVRITEEGHLIKTERFMAFETAEYSEIEATKTRAEDLCLAEGQRLEKLGLQVELRV